MRDVGLASPLELASGCPLWVYGDSYGIEASWVSAYMHANSRLARTLESLVAPESYAISSSPAAQVAYGLIAATSGGASGYPAAVSGAYWDGSRRGIVSLSAGIPDSMGYGTQAGATSASATDAAHQAGVQSAFRAVLAVLSSASRSDFSTGATETGTWATASDAYYSGGSVRYSSTVGSTIEKTVTVPSTGPNAGKVWLLTHSVNTGSPTIEVRVDGALVRTVTAAELLCRGVTYQFGGTANAAPAAFAVPAAAGSRVIRLTHAGSAGQNLFADALLLPSTAPVPVLVAQEHPPLAGGALTSVTTLLSNKAIIDPLLRAVVDEFGNARWCPDRVTDAGLWSGDLVHPNDLGQAQRYGALLTGLRDLLALNGPMPGMYATL